MRAFLLFIFSSAAALVTASQGGAQYLPPSPGAQYMPPSPGAEYAPASPGYSQPGSTWRDQRANQDWRNNTWREQRYNEDWRNNNWRQQRANEDWRAREEYQKKSMPNNAVDRGSVTTQPTGTINNSTTATKNDNRPSITTKNNLISGRNPAEANKKSAEQECGFNSVATPRPCLTYEENKAKPDQSTDTSKDNAVKDKKPAKQPRP